MSKRTIIRTDSILDDRVGGKAYVGAPDGGTNYESVQEAVDYLGDERYNTPLHSKTAREVTVEVEQYLGNRPVRWTYAPEGRVTYIEVTTKQVLAVYRGTARPAR